MHVDIHNCDIVATAIVCWSGARLVSAQMLEGGKTRVVNDSAVTQIDIGNVPGLLEALEDATGAIRDPARVVADQVIERQRIDSSPRELYVIVMNRGTNAIRFTDGLRADEIDAARGKALQGPYVQLLRVP